MRFDALTSTKFAPGDSSGSSSDEAAEMDSGDEAAEMGSGDEPDEPERWTAEPSEDCNDCTFMPYASYATCHAPKETDGPGLNAVEAAEYRDPRH